MERRVTSHTEEEEMNQRRDLLALARKGDQKAVSKLMELYQVRVYSGDTLKSLKIRKLPSRPVSPKHKEALPTAKKSERKPLPEVVQKPEPTPSKSEKSLRPGSSIKGQAPKQKKAQSATKNVVKAKTQPKPKVQAKPSSKSKPTQTTKVKAKPKVIPKAKVQPKAQKKSGAKITSKPKAKAKTQSKTQSQFASTSRAKAKANPKVKAKRR
jgi:hypothetical protein